MSTVTEHYENLLADHYTWMCGGFDVRMEANRQFFSAQGIASTKSGVAVDLGAGSGFQAIPLAQMGFRVLAFDLSQKLLDELECNRGSLPITVVQDDLLSFQAHCKAPVELCVCMGDTLPHLETFDQVQLLFERVYRSLESGGRFVLTFRDLTVELTGLDRFIPVRSGPDTIFSCFLEYEPEHVRVHDLVYTRNGDSWELHKSWYRKLRIPMEWAVACMEKAGFIVSLRENMGGMLTIIAEKPTA